MDDGARSTSSLGDELTPSVFRQAGVGSLRSSDAETTVVRFHRILEANVVGIGYGIDDRILDANTALMAAIGLQPVDMDIGVALHTIFGIEAEAIDMLFDGRANGYDITRIDGTEAHVLASVIRLGEHDWLLLAVDLTARNAAEQAVRHLALHDPATGVPNRRLLMDRLDRALARARRDGSVVALLFCDIDRFKDVNDRYGHRAGDAVLQTTATRLASVMRQYDTVARVGGDEFVILLGHVADRTDPAHLAERARVAIKTPIELEDRELQVTASVGVAVTVGAKYDADTLLRRADDAMYLAKDRGRDQVAFDIDDLIGRD